MPNIPKAKIAVIGGTGLENIEGLTDIQQVNIDTPFGKPSDAITIGKLDGVGVAFLPRHGRGHFISPTELPTRANIYALKSLGAEQIVAVCSCGSFKQELAPGNLVIPDQIIDRTRNRISTFFTDGIVAHIGFAEPFLPGTEPDSLPIGKRGQRNRACQRHLCLYGGSRFFHPCRV